jgi:hypothetical protein
MINSYDYEIVLPTIALYLLTIYGLLAMYKAGINLSDKKVCSLMKMYNMMQVCYNGYVVYGLVSNADMVEVEGLGLVPNLTFINKKYSDSSYYFIYLHFLSKYIDMMDTVFMALRNKRRQISFLHLYHHITILLIWSFSMFNGKAYGYASFLALINSCIHFMMYFHYFITSMGCTNPFKKYLTRMQIGQFYTVIGVAILSMMYDKEYGVFFPALIAIYVMSLIFLFTSFYKKSYIKAE